MPALIEPTERGLYCRQGDFYVDPWRPVGRAIVTHAHGDHACRDCERYLTAHEGRHVLAARIGSDATIDTLPYGQAIEHNGVRVSLHPAGHVLGSAQVRIEWQGQVTVVSGDYKRDADPTCTPFESIRCHTFLTESTFGLPIYRWPSPSSVIEQINGWWRANAELERPSVLFAYALGKAQRIISGLDPEIGPVITHGAVERMVRAYRETGVHLPETCMVSEVDQPKALRRAIVIAPPSAQGTPWLRRFGNPSTAFASGWMRIRGTRRRRAVDRGFVLSDHADWPSLLRSIDETGAEDIWVTHGYSTTVARWLREQGRRSLVVATRFTGELVEGELPEAAVDQDSPPATDAAEASLP